MTYENTVNHHGISLGRCVRRMVRIKVRRATLAMRTYHIPMCLIVAWGGAVVIAILS